MAAPGISSVTGSLYAGATGIVIAGGGFGAFEGQVWLRANADGSGAADQLTVDGTWDDLSITDVEVPAILNNTPGTRYLQVFDSGLNGSPLHPVTLSAAGIIDVRPVIRAYAMGKDGASRRRFVYGGV